MSLTIYGIKNCDTMKKARTWLDDHGLAYAFHDYKASGVDEKTLRAWAKQVGWEKLADGGATLDDQAPGPGARGACRAGVQAGAIRRTVP